MSENNIVAQEKEIVENISVPVEQNTQVEETVQDRNWRKFREDREQDRKQREAAEKMAREKGAEAQALKEAMDALLNRPQNNQQQQQFEEDESEDVKIQKKIDHALRERDKKYEQERIEREKAEYPNKLKSTYQDFNDVCSTSNLDYLEYHYPEIAKAFVHMPDSFDKWSSVYHACKKLIPNSDSKKDQLKAEKNMAKPQSMSVAGSTSTTDSAPHILDEKRKADNWARMTRIRKGV